MSLVERSTHDGIAHVQFNRPEKRNALSDDMFEAVVDAVETVSAEDDLDAIVLSGAGVSFCAGLDFATHAAFAAEGSTGERPFADPDDPASGGKRRPGRGQRVVRALRDAHAPVIAAVHGHAIGAGFQIALGADFRLVTADVKMGCAEINFGLTVDMGASQLLPPLIGADRALELLLTGRLISGEEAVAWGAATRVCADPLADAFALAHSIATRSRRAVRANRALVRLAETASVADGMHEELRVMSTNIGSPEQVAAADAFLASRQTAAAAAR